MGDIKILALSGLFIDRDTTSVDMLIVGDIDKTRLAGYINNDLKTERPVKFTIMSEEDYRYRVNCNDKFVTEIINNHNVITPRNTF